MSLVMVTYLDSVDPMILRARAIPNPIAQAKL